jgi:peptidoglycan/LPS O-acetylase OafA/YrhL
MMIALATLGGMITALLVWNKQTPWTQIGGLAASGALATSLCISAITEAPFETMAGDAAGSTLAATALAAFLHIWRKRNRTGGHK